MFHTCILLLQIRGQSVLTVCEDLLDSVVMNDVRKASRQKVTWARNASVDPK